MNLNLLKFLSPIALILCGTTFANNAKVDIEFKGKKSILISDVCKNIGKPYSSIIFDYGQLECTPNFNEYGGIPLISEKKDSCDSKIEYEPTSGKLVKFEIKYERNSFDNVLNVLAEKYGKPTYRDVKISSDKSLNGIYEWEDAKGGYISLSLNAVAYFKEGSLVRTVERYCTVLNIRTHEMKNLFETMRVKSENSIKKSIIENAKKL